MPSGALGISSLHLKAGAFLKSKAHIFGQIGPLTRARVSELQSFDPERPAGPSQRVPCNDLGPNFLGVIRFHPEVAQRGIPGTASILEALVEGLDAPRGNRIYLLDLMPNRQHYCILNGHVLTASSHVLSRKFWRLPQRLIDSEVRYNEWGQAAWTLQKKYLTAPGGHDWRYMAYMSGEDAEFIHLSEIKNLSMGKLISVILSVVFTISWLSRFSPCIPFSLPHSDSCQGVLGHM